MIEVPGSRSGRQVYEVESEFVRRFSRGWAVVCWPGMTSLEWCQSLVTDVCGAAISTYR